jgi:hypothetical protein
MFDFTRIYDLHKILKSKNFSFEKLKLIRISFTIEQS